MTVTDLLNAGYKKFPPSICHPTAGALYQHIVQEGGKRLYFVNVHHWIAPGVLEGEVELYLSDGSWFTLQIHNLQKGWTVDQLESFIEAAYDNLDCVPDLNNNL